MDRLNVFVFPDYRGSNPYQTLYYDDLSCHVRVRYRSIDGALLLQATTIDEGGSVFHLHWEDAVYRQAEDNAGAWRAAQDFVRKVTEFRARGGRFVWTVHNEMPHDDLHLDVHAWLVRKLSGCADGIHVHCRSAARHLVSTRGVNPDKLIVAPHGNFLGYYARWQGSQGEARRRHQLSEKCRILLLFGRLGSYKGAPDLLSCIRQLDLPNTCLVIAGKQIDPIDPGKAVASENVIVRNQFIDDDDISSLFAAADFVVAPYRRIFTSGTAVLALSMGRPVIAPRLFHIEETIVDGKTGFLYDVNDPAGLSQQLQRSASAACIDKMKLDARIAGERLTWNGTSQKILSFYRQLWNLPEDRAAL
jgi:glycosyltransferase involved in cell wall biosynthesis